VTRSGPSLVAIAGLGVVTFAALTAAAVSVAALCTSGGDAPRAAAAPAAPESPAPAPAKETAAPVRPLREIRVRLAADEEFRSHPNWKGEAAMRLTFASDVYEREFRIRWVIAGFAEWKSDDDAPQLDDLLEAAAKLPSSDVDFVMAFSGQSRAAGSPRPYALDGEARFFGRIAIVRSAGVALPDSDDTYVLCHELGHALGAWHEADSKSVMSPHVSATSRTFDDVTRGIVETARDIDFARGVEWLGPERESRLVDLYRRSRPVKGEEFSPASAWELRASALAADNSPEDAAEAWERAASLHEAAEGPGRRSTMRSRLAAARSRVTAANFEAAQRIAEAAVADAGAHPDAESVAGEAEEELADVVEKRGDAARAEGLREHVLEVRRTKLGFDAAETRRVADLVRAKAAHAPALASLTVRTKTEFDETHTVTEVDAFAPDPDVGADGRAVADGRTAGPLQFRVVADADLPPEWRREDEFFGEVLEVTSDAPGHLRVALDEDGGAERIEHPSRIAASVECGTFAHAAARVRVRFRPGKGFDAGTRWDAVLDAWSLDTWNVGDHPVQGVNYVAVAGPADGTVVRWRPEAPDWRSARIAETTATLRTWRWYPRTEPSGTVTTDSASGRVLVDGRAVGPQDGGNGWRLSVMFEPANPGQRR
jgi:hypothetical protein